MKKLQRLELLKDFVQEAVDRGATSVEAIHQHIAGLPFEALEMIGVLKRDGLGLRAKQQRTIGAVYGAIRRVNREVGQLLSDQFENVEDTKHVSTLLDDAPPAPKAPPRKPVAKKVAPRKAVLKKAPAKAAVRKTPAKKAPIKKPTKAPRKKPAAKKVPKKSAPKKAR